MPQNCPHYTTYFHIFKISARKRKEHSNEIISNYISRKALTSASCRYYIKSPKNQANTFTSTDILFEYKARGANFTEICKMLKSPFSLQNVGYNNNTILTIQTDKNKSNYYSIIIFPSSKKNTRKVRNSYPKQTNVYLLNGLSTIMGCNGL